jgi:hypothetical protein
VKEPARLGPGAWHFDARQKNLYIRVEAREGETVVTHVRF